MNATDPSGLIIANDGPIYPQKRPPGPAKPKTTPPIIIGEDPKHKPYVKYDKLNPTFWDLYWEYLFPWNNPAKSSTPEKAIKWCGWGMAAVGGGTAAGLAAMGPGGGGIAWMSYEGSPLGHFLVRIGGEWWHAIGPPGGMFLVRFNGQDPNWWTSITGLPFYNSDPESIQNAYNCFTAVLRGLFG